MPKFQHKRTGRIVDLDDQDPRVARLDAASKWERHIPADLRAEMEAGSQGEGKDEGTGPSDTEVREWALAQGKAVSARGRLPRELVEEYKAAQAG